MLIAYTRHRTALWESLCVVTGQTPIDLLLDERRDLYEVRKGRDAEINVIGKDTEDVKKVIRREIIKTWQTRWKTSTKGQVTFIFFSSIQERLQVEWIQPDY